VGHRALAEAAHLGKNEPHPVRLFAAAPEFVADLWIDRLLRVDEALQFGRVGFIRWIVRAGQKRLLTFLLISIG
jgi:hypothetical protein